MTTTINKCFDQHAYLFNSIVIRKDTLMEFKS